jgi:hypothetical protein
MNGCLDDKIGGQYATCLLSRHTLQEEAPINSKEFKRLLMPTQDTKTAADLVMKTPNQIRALSIRVSLVILALGFSALGFVSFVNTQPDSLLSGRRNVCDG